MKKGTILRRVISIALSLALVVYAGYHFYSAYHDVIKTEYALDYTYHRSVSLKGFFVRNEEPVQSSAEGIVSYCQSSGTKVPAGHVVAKVFSNSDQAAVQAQIDAIDETLQSISGLQTAGTQLTADVQLLDTRINQSLNTMLSITDSGTVAGYDMATTELIQLLNKKQITLGTAGDFTAYIADLNAKKASLAASLTSYGQITTPSAGYFVNGSDGCETVIDFETVADLTLEQVNNALNTQPKQTGAVGRVLYTNEWYVTAVADQSISQLVQLSDKVQITVPIISDQVYDCEVTALNVDYATNQAVLVLKCSQLNSKIANARIEDVQLRINTYQGLRVNQSALRVVDGITGVYVVDGISAAFKPVDIAYSDTDFVICKYDPSHTQGLKQYDEVIVNGGDLYDGKVIR